MNRRKFFHHLSLGVFTSLSILGYFSLSRQKNKKNTVLIPENTIADKTFLHGIFIQIQNGEPKFLLAKCTHLGCKINQLANETLLCPCHGSVFNLNGEVLEGPADKKLYTLNFDYRAEDKIYIVYKDI